MTQVDINQVVILQNQVAIMTALRSMLDAGQSPAQWDSRDKLAKRIETTSRFAQSLQTKDWGPL